MIENYLLHILILMCIYAIASTSLNLALGYTGILNLGHIAFIAIGAYTSAQLTNLGLPYLFSFLFAGAFASITGAGIVYLTKKLKGDYIALATLAFTFVTYSLLLNLTWLTNGPLGIAGISSPSLLGWKVNTLLFHAGWTVIITLVCIISTTAIVNSPFGRLLQALRDDEIGLKVLGKNTYLLKTKAMMISAFFAGIAGSLLAHYLTYIEPSSFQLTELIIILTIVIVGGLASIKGTLIATLILISLPELLRLLAIPSSILGPARHIIYALILLCLLLYKPRGICGRVDIS